MNKYFYWLSGLICCCVTLILINLMIMHTKITCMYERQELKFQDLGTVNCYMYNPVKEQTDNTPNVTACGEFVFTGSIAISQDLKRQGLNFGDKVYIPLFNDFYIVNDVMNKRHKKSIDIFTYNMEQAKAWGSKKVKIYKIMTGEMYD